MPKKIVQNLLHKDLSYAVHGAAIEVRKDFGPGHKEKLYQGAFAEELKRCKIPFEKEKAVKVYSPKDGKYIGLYRPDFIIDNKIIIETKAEKFVSRDEIKRIYDYLRNSECELAYFINFASPRLFVRRIIYTNDRKPFLKKLLVSLSLVLVLFSGLSEAQGAELFFGAHSKEVGLGKTFEVGAFVNTEGELINAIEGEVIFPSDLELIEMRDGNSILNLWIKRPQLVEAGRVSFAGIIPGGFGGNRGHLFSLILRAKEEGQITIATSDERILLNDGQGSPTNVKRAPLSINISEGATAEEFLPSLDSDPPEDFTPIITRNPNLFDNQYFLVFAAQDKGSGIREYQIQERKFFKNSAERRWITAESPYLLKDQKLRSHIFVKVIDNAGNERLATLPPQTPWYKDYVVWSIIILSILLLYAFPRLHLWKIVVLRNRDYARKRRGTKARN